VAAAEVEHVIAGLQPERVDRGQVLAPGLARHHPRDQPAQRAARVP
jgi:hypothetical protein